MSTKCTLLLTTQNEHWYREQNATYYENANTNECLVLEFGPGHKVETDEDGTRVIIEEGTPLHEALMAARWDREAGQGPSGEVVTLDELPELLRRLDKGGH